MLWGANWCSPAFPMAAFCRCASFGFARRARPPPPSPAAVRASSTQGQPETGRARQAAPGRVSSGNRLLGTRPRIARGVLQQRRMMIFATAMMIAIAAGLTRSAVGMALGRGADRGHLRTGRRRLARTRLLAVPCPRLCRLQCRPDPAFRRPRRHRASQGRLNSPPLALRFRSPAVRANGLWGPRTRMR